MLHRDAVPPALCSQAQKFKVVRVLVSHTAFVHDLAMVYGTLAQVFFNRIGDTETHRFAPCVQPTLRYWKTIHFIEAQNESCLYRIP